jgi:hypothetical protein
LELTGLPITDIDNPLFAKDTSVIEMRQAYCRTVCSEVIENFLYLGSDFIAKSKEILLDRGITHVLNCSGGYSPNYHLDTFKYKTYQLKDSPIELIEACFYETIDFLQDVRDQGGRVYVHCV